jgi:hypothetical protein
LAHYYRQGRPSYDVDQLAAVGRLRPALMQATKGTMPQAWQLEIEILATKILGS